MDYRWPHGHPKCLKKIVSSYYTIIYLVSSTEQNSSPTCQSNHP